MDSSFIVKAYLEKQIDINFNDIPTSTERFVNNVSMGWSK